MPASKQTSTQAALVDHLAQLSACTLCPDMCKPVVTGGPVMSPIYLCGQAPGIHEGDFGKPFAWTAGKTLFRWLAQTGVTEEEFRSQVYMGAVCRCFPGKGKTGGDRVPSPLEIKNCSSWMKREFDILQPQLVLPVGKLAIELFFPGKMLTETVGQCITAEAFGRPAQFICLPHPSGASTWFKKDPGKTLLLQALDLLKLHPVWSEVFPNATLKP